MDVLDKIRAEIATHENELERLRIARDVLESLMGKPDPKAKPLISLRGVSHQEKPQKEETPPRGYKPDRKKAIKQPGAVSNVTIRATILDLLNKAPANAGEIKRGFPKGVLATRSQNAVSSVLSNLKQSGVIGQDPTGEKRYFIMHREDHAADVQAALSANEEAA